MPSTETGASIPSVRPEIRARSIGLGVVVVILMAFVGYSVWHETQKSVRAPIMAEHETVHGMGEAERPPMSADEERYAHSLWQVHDNVRTSAVKMTFAGLAYKLGDTDKGKMRATVTPLIGVFKEAHGKVSLLKAPEKLHAVHGDYLEALRLYQEASREMTKSTKEGDDAHLLIAHGMSEKASSLLLKVGDALWPGEYKPN